MQNHAPSPLRAAVRMCRRSVRAGAFACELAARRRWLDARDAQWIAQNLSALRGVAIEVNGDPPVFPRESPAALVVSEASADAALALLAVVPIASVGPSLAEHAEAWWPRDASGPVLLSSHDGAALGAIAAQRGSIVPVAARLAPEVSGTTLVRLWFGAEIELEPAEASWSAVARARDEIERLPAA